MSGRSFLSTTPNGVARLAGTDDDWTVDRHLRGEDVRSLAAGPPGSDLVFAGTDGNGVYRSEDRGRRWTRCGLDGEVVTSLAVAPGDLDRLYAGVRPSGVFRSSDGGTTWSECETFESIRGRRLWRSPASPPFTAYVQALAVSPDDPDLVVAGVEFGAVVRSDDGGETWSNHRRKAIRDCHSLAWHATDERCVYEAGAGIPRRPGARSIDAGESWVKPGGGLDRGYGWAVAAHPAEPEVWYVSASTGPFAAHGDGAAEATIFRRDDGESWTGLDAFPGDRMPYGLCTDPEFPDLVWAGRADGPIFRSTDRGDTWERLGGELSAVDGTMVMLTSG